MDFSLTDDQTELVNLFDGMLKREVPTTRVREAEPTGCKTAYQCFGTRFAGAWIGINHHHPGTSDRTL